MVMIDSIGFAPHEVGNDDESQITRLRISRDSPRELAVVRRSSSPIFVVACACAEVSVVRYGSKRRSAQYAASAAFVNRGRGNGPTRSLDGSSTLRAPAANITSTARCAAKRR